MERHRRLFCPQFPLRPEGCRRGGPRLLRLRVGSGRGSGAGGGQCPRRSPRARQAPSVSHAASSAAPTASCGAGPAASGPACAVPAVIDTRVGTYGSAAEASRGVSAILNMAFLLPSPASPSRAPSRGLARPTGEEPLHRPDLFIWFLFFFFFPISLCMYLFSSSSCFPSSSLQRKLPSWTGEWKELLLPPPERMSPIKGEPRRRPESDTQRSMRTREGTREKGLQQASEHTRGEHGDPRFPVTPGRIPRSPWQIPGPAVSSNVKASGGKKIFFFFFVFNKRESFQNI